MRAFVLQSKADGKPGAVYHPAGVQSVPTPTVQSGEVLVQLLAAAYNRRLALAMIWASDAVAYCLCRDLFSRQGL